MLSLSELVELARETEITDPIDWGMLNIDEENAYALVASGVLELCQTLDTDEQKIQALMATAVKLTVENFVLNIRLLQSQEK